MNYENTLMTDISFREMENVEGGCPFWDLLKAIFGGYSGPICKSIETPGSGVDKMRAGMGDF